MPQSGLTFDKEIQHLTKRVLDFFERVRYSYLSAKEDPVEYGDKWKSTVKSIREKYDGIGSFSKELKRWIDEDVLHDKEVMNPEGVRAKSLFMSIKAMRFKSDKISDPFSDQLGDNVYETLMENDSVFVAFIHYALRSHANTLPDKVLEKHGFEPDRITEDMLGLDLEPKDIPLYIKEHYGDDKDTKRVTARFKSLFKVVKKLFLVKYDEDNWENLLALDISKAESVKKKPNEDADFLIPNKPMYRIFEIKDMHQIKGLTSEFVVQEKYDGMRIQIHKLKDVIKIYSYNQKDITKKCKEQVEELKDKKFGDCILDAELILFDGDDALHRADTIKHVFKKKTKGRLRAHVFDIMKHEDKMMLDETLRERINVLFYQYSQHSSEVLAFPSKKDTRIADSIEEVEKYAEAIMELPTSEGVVIKDIESTYYKGIKKNPKWIKWKKFVDLDVIVLDKKKTKSNLHSYTMGIGPLTEEEQDEYDTVELDGEFYLPVGKALNTKQSVAIGSIIRVKVDEVKKGKKGFSLYSAKLSEIPEVDTSDKLLTLEQLSKKSKKTLDSIYKVKSEDKDMKKSYTITDTIHGDAEIILKSDLDGFTIYGFDGDSLMEKNAVADLDLWKEQLADLIHKEKSKVYQAIQVEMTGDDSSNPKEMTLEEVFEFAEKNFPREIDTHWQGQPIKLARGMNKRGAFVYDSANQTFSLNPSNITKSDDHFFQLYKREDGNLDFILGIENTKNAWTIKIDKDSDIYDLFGKSGKYPAIVSTNTDKKKLIDEGKLSLGMQKNGYHEYKINGDKFKTRVHLRVVPMNEKNTWIAWTGKKQTMIETQGKQHMWDITEDKYAELPFPK